MSKVQILSVPFKQNKRGETMRLGELRSLTRDYDNRLFIELSNYENLDPPTQRLEVDIITDKAIYFRIVDEEKNQLKK